MAAHPCVEVIVSRLVNLGVVRVACQQSASVTSDTGCSNYRLLQLQAARAVYACMHTYFKAESLHLVLVSYSVTGWTDSVEHPLVVAMIVMAASAAWREVEAAQFQ